MFVEPVLGNITIFAGNFEPRGWKFCQGQLLSIAENDALFSLLGTTYGGDGVETFALPDLRGRVAVHAGQAPGMNTYIPGQQGGTETRPLTAQEIRVHTHLFQNLTGGAPGASGVAGNSADPSNNVPAVTTGINSYNTDGTGAMAQTQVTTQSVPAGGSQPISLVSPVLGLNYVIAVEGIYPSRN